MTTNPPRIVVILRPDGSIEDVSVFSHDHQDRIEGFHIIEALTQELETFESRAKTCLQMQKRPRRNELAN